MRSLKEIFQYTFQYKRLASLTILCNFLFVVFNLLSLILFIPFLQLIFQTESLQKAISEPFFSGNITDLANYIKDVYNYQMQQMVAKNPLDALFFVCISVVTAFFLKNLFRYGAVWFQSELRMSVVRDIRTKLFNKSLNLPMSFHTQEKKGDLMARMNSDVGEIENAVISMMELIFREPISILIHVITLIYISPSLTLFSFFLLPISALVISRIGKSLKRTAKKGQEQMGLLYSAMDEGLGGIRIIKAFNAGKFISKNFKKINLRHQKLITRAFRKRDLSPLLNETIGAAVMMCLVWFGGSMILSGDSIGNELTGELFITFIIVFSQLLRPIQGISNSIANLNKSKASQDRINDIINLDEKIKNSKNPISLKSFNNIITYNNVSFQYKNEPVLKNINISVKKGETIALVGESGSGKSTIADLLPRFYDTQEGEIKVDDHNVKDIDLKDLRNQIGIVSQESILFNAPVIENIAFGDLNPKIEDVISAAKTANAHEFILELENGYKTHIGERGNMLSGGQKQRLCIARAIYKNPEIMILDEATSALDTQSEKQVQEALKNLMKNRTSIIIAHRLSTIKDANEILVLSKGQIIERGTHDDLIKLNGAYFKLCSLQGINS